MENLEVFAAVVEQKSINRASRLLNVSQPAVSRKIIGLEDSLGVRLFERHGKRLALTHAGRVCYEYAVQMRRLKRDMLMAVDKLKDHPAEMTLTVGASLTTLQSTLPDLIAHYTALFPHADIHVLTGKTHEIISYVREKKVDLGLTASTVDQYGLHCVPLFEDRLCMVLPSGHPLLEKNGLTMADLNGMPMILFSRGTWYRILVDDLFHRFGVFPDVKMEIDSFEAIIRLVPLLRIATFLPLSYLRQQMLTDNDLHLCRIPGLEEAKRTTSLVFSEEASRLASIRTFVDEAKVYFSRGPHGDPLFPTEEGAGETD